MRALFLATYPISAAATRFRAFQFFPHLARSGIDCRLSPFLSEDEFRHLYVPRGAVRKGLRLLLRGVLRVAESARSGGYDVVVVQRAAMLYGPPLMEWLVSRVIGSPLVYDYDDAIWLSDASPVWGRWADLLKFPAKTRQIIHMARHIVACNAFTRDYALQFRDAHDVTVIPTVVDADVFCPAPRLDQSQLVVGWIGTHSTARYLESIAEPLARVARRRRFRLKVVGAGRDIRIPGVEVENKPWRLEDEVSDYQSLDIGLYPVLDDAWGRGKTGFKPVVYLSCGVPCICSPVGGVTEFIEHGANGLFARTPAQWEAALDTLLGDAALRASLAAAGRHTVLAGYSLQVQAPRLAEVMLRTAASRPRVQV